jgi:Major Facilitator Superfamily.
MITAIRTVFFHQTIALPLYMERDLGDDSLYGAMLVLNQVIIISTTPLFSYSVYYFSEYQIFILSGFIAIISPLTFIFGASYTTITAFIVLTSIGESLLLPRILEYSLNVAPRGKEGVIITISSLPLLLCYIIAGIIGSLLLDSYCPSEGDRECWKMWIIISIVAVPPTFILLFCKKWLEDKDFESNPFISCSKESKNR